MPAQRDRREGMHVTAPLRIGTRGSRLALWQAHYVRDRLQPLANPRPVELVEIATSGDIIHDVSLSQLGGQGVFTKEIQKALQAEQIDVAVHSLKDLPTLPVESLTLAAVPERGPRGDVLVAREVSSFAALPTSAKVATSSLRRKAQLLHERPDLEVVDIRGNVETRLRKLQDQQLDGIILAEAGLIRLELSEVITEVLDVSVMLPAVGQGALGLECRQDDDSTLSLLRQLNHDETYYSVLSERAFLRTLEGGCQVPLGALTHVEQSELTLQVVVISPDGKKKLEGSLSGSLPQGAELGEQLAQQLLQQGAAELLVS